MLAAPQRSHGGLPSLGLNLSAVAPSDVNGREACGSQGDLNEGQAIGQSEILNGNEPAVSVRRHFWLRQFKNKTQPKHL